MLGWIALVPLLCLIHGLPPGRAFRLATAAGSAGYALVLFWLFVVVYVHGRAPAALGVVAVLLMSGAFGLHVGAVAWLVRRLEPGAGWLAALVLPAAWVGLEYLRGVLVFGGLPWALLGHSVHQNGPLRELAALGGVSGLSFALAFHAQLLVRGRWRTAILLLVGLHLSGFAIGLAERGDPGDARGEPLRAGIVQGNIPQGEKWDPGRADAAFAAHLEASRLAAAGADLDWIVWPEAAIPVLVELEGQKRRALEELAVETGATLIVGGMGVELGPDGRIARFYNSAFVIGPDGAFLDRYDKAKLVPFGEYVPLRGLLGALSGLATGLASRDVTPGPGPRVLRGPGSPAPAALICYEAIYPALVRESVRGGARALLNLTNDAWYGRSSAPHQFLAIARMRSAEHGLPMLRAANTGISAVIDAGGALLEATPLFERRVLVAPLPPPRPGRTLYTRLGDVAVLASFAILAAALLAGTRRRIQASVPSQGSPPPGPGEDGAGVSAP